MAFTQNTKISGSDKLKISLPESLNPLKNNTPVFSFEDLEELKRKNIALSPNPEDKPTGFRIVDGKVVKIVDGNEVESRECEVLLLIRDKTDEGADYFFDHNREWVAYICKNDGKGSNIPFKGIIEIRRNNEIQVRIGDRMVSHPSSYLHFVDLDILKQKNEQSQGFRVEKGTFNIEKAIINPGDVCAILLVVDKINTKVYSKENEWIAFSCPKVIDRDGGENLDDLP